MDRFITDLMDRMTLREKLGQLNLPSGGDLVTGSVMNGELSDMIRKQEIGGFFNVKGIQKINALQHLAVEESRLKIPLLVGADVIHGYETIFPIPLALSCSWDTLAVERMARISAIEASADGINWTFSPMVDICRDARWGRIAEGSGEDPYLGSLMAKAYVRGYQGNNMQGNDEILACVKHFALYGASESGRDYNVVDMSCLRMYNEYLAPYKAAVDAGVGSIMSSFNIVDGIPATANKWLLTDLLRNEWGFGGLLVTDYNSIAEMSSHGVAPLKEASIRALQAGTDMDMVSCGFLNTLEESLKEAKVTEEQINMACRRVLEAKYKLGLFDNPYKYCDPKRPARDIFTKAHRDAARRIAAESFVLLKNDSPDGNPNGNPLLPFNPKGNIAVIGPLANSRSNMPGTWSVAAVLDRCPSLVEGLKEMTAGKANIMYAKGSNLISDASYEERATMFGRSLNRDNRTDQQLLDEALNVARRSDIIIAALGESSEMSGESSSRTDLNIPDVQQNLLKELLKTGKPVVLVLFTGRPLTLNWEQEHVPAILNVWFGGSEAAYAIGDALFGYVNPGGKLTMTFPKNVGQIPLYYAQPVGGGTAPVRLPALLEPPGAPGRAGVRPDHFHPRAGGAVPHRTGPPVFADGPGPGRPGSAVPPHLSGGRRRGQPAHCGLPLHLWGGRLFAAVGGKPRPHSAAGLRGAVLRAGGAAGAHPPGRFGHSVFEGAQPGVQRGVFPRPAHCPAAGGLHPDAPASAGGPPADPNARLWAGGAVPVRDGDVPLSAGHRGVQPGGRLLQRRFTGGPAGV